MKTVRTTFLPNQKNNSVYFDAEETEHYFEENRGRKTTERQKEYHRRLETIINAAYNQGYEDGLAKATAEV